ncbi:MAG: tetratricopeptide repeat protein [Acetobacteraceae bacterium]
MDLIIGQKPETAAGAASGSALIVEGDEKTFMKEVVEASRNVPVLVDFWATWCGPCKQLGPMLEKVVTAAGGRIKLVKIDIDKNRALVQQLAGLGLPLQSVPTVAAFWQGQIADLFQGALPESEIKRFVEDVLKQAGGAMPGADLLPAAKAALEEGNGAEAASLYEEAVAADAESAEAWGGLIRAELAAGREAAAEKTLGKVPAKLAEHAEIAGARAAVALAGEGRKATAGLKSLEARLAANPADFEAGYDLATALNALGRREEAAEALLQIIRRDRVWRDDGARLQLLKFFEAWGFDDPAATAARRKLSALLFR